ncbi:site-2 protease family protein [Candidatus Latescibacterota bacterium]
MLYRRKIIKPSDGYFKDITELQPPQRDNRRLNFVLFIATVLSTTFVGSFNAGSDPFTLHGLLKGLPFSATILTILGVHEFAHYFTARYWGIRVTLPYFIPAPISPIGTFGAVIKMKSSIPTRKALIDVGSSGPIAGFIVSFFACYFGLQMSTIVQAEGNIPFFLGESLLFKTLCFQHFGHMPDGQIIQLHSVAFAGWIGLFVTALNLIPIGQLDGGHILFAFSPKIHELIRRLRVPFLILLGLTFWSGWYVWAVLSLFFGRAHPLPDRMDQRVGSVRATIAFVASVIFIICITPTPIIIGNM